MIAMPFAHISLSLLCLFALLCAAFAIKGPLPSEVAPSSYASDQLKKVYTPIKSSSCSRTSPPVITDTFAYPFDFEPSQTSFGIRVDWCDDAPLRYRLLEYSGTSENPVTNVLEAFISTEAFVLKNIDPRCRPHKVYFEACVRPAKQARALCATSEIQHIKEFDVPEPRLKFRPPIHLDLAPGDTAKIVTQTVNVTTRGPLGNGGYDFKPEYLTRPFRSFHMRMRVSSKSGRTMALTNPFVLRKGATNHIRKRDTTGWRRRFYNGASAFLEFALPSCVVNVGSFKSRYSTKIRVSNKVKSLVKQDSKIPTLKQPEFTPIKSGDSASITVEATNVGGGMRMGGVPTELHYQWYLRTEDYALAPTYAEPIEGATGPTLKLEKVECDIVNLSRYVVSGFKDYYVDVCNTYGCRRSEKISARYIKDDGTIGSDGDC